MGRSHDPLLQMAYLFACLSPFPHSSTSGCVMLTLPDHAQSLGTVLQSNGEL